MKINILIGGKAGQGINKISKIVSEILIKHGYFIFGYRDYQSLIRGGHNFNVLTISDKQVASNESQLDGIIALDEKTPKLHKNQLKKQGFTLIPDNFKDLGLNLNIALVGAFTKILGIDKDTFLNEIKKQFNNKEALDAAEQGYKSQKERFNLKKLNNKISIMSGSQAVAQGSINSGIEIYIAYPMTPATELMHELAAKQLENNFIVFQPESEITVINSALGASFTGAKVMVGTSGGGFDLMTEALSFQGQSEIPLVVYLASRSGPGTGLPTYTSQADLNIALRSGHGEFPRVVIAPGDPVESIETTNQAFYLSQKFNTLSIILSDKHLAESQFSFSIHAQKPLQIKSNRLIPGKAIVKSTSYEHDKFGNTIENAELTAKNAERLLEKYEAIKKESAKFEMIKLHGKPHSKNLIIAWGSTKGAILDAIKDLDCKFLQVLYLKPLSNKIKEEMQKAKNIILVENNSTGQLGRLIREKTGIKIENRILKYDARPFLSNELKKQILKIIK